MKMRCYKTTIFLSALAVLLALPFLAAGIGIGIAPTEIRIDDALRSIEYERALTVFNPGDDADNFTFRVDGDAAGWISIRDAADSGVIVKRMSIDGKGKQSLILKISVPQDEATGTYNATIYAETVPLGTNGTAGEVRAVLTAKSIVSIGITGDQIVSGTVSAVAIEENTEPGYPLRIGTIFKNTGNVIANPKIFVRIQKDSGVISSFTYEGTRVKPQSTEIIIAEWNTTTAESVGDYLAGVKVSLGGRELASESIPFKVLPVGTFTRQGNLTNIVVEGEPVVDTAVKVNAYFRNTGRIDALAKFGGEVYRDGMRIDALASDELLVEKGNEAPLVSYLRLSSPGSYAIKGRVVYSGKETETKEVSFAVPEKEADNSPSAYAVAGSATGSGVWYVIAGGAALAFGTLIAIARRRMNGKILHS